MKKIIFLLTGWFAASAYAFSPGQFSVSFAGHNFNLNTIAVEPEQIGTLEEYDTPVRFEIVYVNDIQKIGQIDTKNKMVLTDRGITTFGYKFELAQQAGAAGLVVVNILSDKIFSMELGVPLTPIGIYGLMISGADGSVVKKQLETGKPVFITIQPATEKSL